VSAPGHGSVDAGSPAVPPPSAVPAVLVRSEERLAVSTEWVATERVVGRKRIVTETRHVEVTVRREELELTREPAPETVGAPGSMPVREPTVLVLREEVPTVTTEVRAYERVTLAVERVAGGETVAATLRREQVEADPVVATAP